MTTTTKAAELDRLIENLQDDLANCPNRLWESEGNQYRLDLLIKYTAKRNALAS
jgi:hypothetical protein